MASHRHPIQKVTGFIGIIAIAAMIIVPTLGLPAGNMRRALTVVLWLLWLALIIMFPISTLVTGVLYSKFGSSERKYEPARFWVGLVTMTILFLVMFACVTFGCVISWSPDS